MQNETKNKDVSDEHIVAEADKALPSISRQKPSQQEEDETKDVIFTKEVKEKNTQENTKEKTKHNANTTDNSTEKLTTAHNGQDLKDERPICSWYQRDCCKLKTKLLVCSYKRIHEAGNKLYMGQLH